MITLLVSISLGSVDFAGDDFHSLLDNQASASAL
jgi:hypothetical protein